MPGPKKFPPSGILPEPKQLFAQLKGQQIGAARQLPAVQQNVLPGTLAKKPMVFCCCCGKNSWVESDIPRLDCFFPRSDFFSKFVFFYRKPPWNMKWKTQASTSKWHLFFSFEIKWQRFFYRENPSHFGLIGMSFDIWFTSRSNSTQSWSTNWAGCRHVKQRKQYPNSFGTIFTPQNKRKQIHYKLIKS